MSFVVLPLLILLPGLAGWLHFGGRFRTKLSGLEAVFVWFLLGTAVFSWASLTLAEFAVFSLPLLLGLVLLPSGLLIGWHGWRGTLKPAVANLPWQWADGLVVGLLLALVLLSGRPSEYIIGGRDHGVYVNTGIHIAKTGSIIVHDSEITAVAAELRQTLILPETRIYEPGFPGPWSQGQRMSGLTIRNLATGEYLPHAFHLYPALIAFFFAVGGVPTALFTTMFLSLLACLAITVTVRRLWGQTTALLTLLLLALSVTQVWFTGYPTAEIIVQLFFWGGLFAFVLLLEGGGRFTAVLTGICLGLLHLAKLDTVLIPPIFGLILLYLWLRGRFRPAYWWGVGAYLLLSMQALLHASFIATIYFLDHSVRSLLPGFLATRLVAAADGHPQPADWLARLVSANWGMWLTAVLLLLLGLWVLRWIRPFLVSRLRQIADPPERAQRWLAIGLALFIAGIVVLGPFISLRQINIITNSFFLSRLYLTRVGVMAGTLGWLGLFYRANSTPQRLTWLVIGGVVAPLYLLGTGTSPDHFWTIRRFMPIAFPALIVGMAWLASALVAWPNGRWLTRLAAAGLIALILAGFLQHIRYIASVVEYAGLTEQLGAVAEQLPEDAIFLLQMGTPAQQLALPFWFLFDKSIFSIRAAVRDDPLLATAVAQWQENGKDVYWLATPETLPPGWPGWEQRWQATYHIQVPMMETPLDHIPHQVETLNIQLDLYQFVQP